MKLKAIKAFSNNYTGNVLPGKIFDVPGDIPEHVATHFAAHGLCEAVLDEVAPAPLVSGPSSPSSPAGRASPSNSASTSDSDGTPGDATSSQLTPASDAPRGAIASTRPTASGGKSTTRKPRKAAKK